MVRAKSKDIEPGVKALHLEVMWAKVRLRVKGTGKDFLSVVFLLKFSYTKDSGYFGSGIGTTVLKYKIPF